MDQNERIELDSPDLSGSEAPLSLAEFTSLLAQYKRKVYELTYLLSDPPINSFD